MSKRESAFCAFWSVLLPSSPKGEIVGIMALWTCVELDGNPLIDKHFSYIHLDGDKKSQEERRGAIYICLSEPLSHWELIGAIEALSHIYAYREVLGLLKPIYACINIIGRCLGA